MADHSQMKLGKRAPRLPAGAPRLAKYSASLPAPPVSVSWADKLAALGMMGNDSLGDCTCAAVGHAIQTWTSQASVEATIPDSAVLSLYEAVGHYVPGQPQTDQGAVISDVLAYWQKNGVGGHAISAYAYVEPGNLSEVRDAIYWFGGCDIGLALPTSAQSQDVWDVPAGGTAGPGQPDSWGGHSVFIVGYDATGLTCITWGALKRMTWAFWATYCDEAWAILSTDWIEKSGAAPDGFPLAQLQSDMAALTAGTAVPRSVSLTDQQIDMLTDAIQTKIDGLDEDDGVVATDAATNAASKPWQDLNDYLNAPRQKT